MTDDAERACPSCGRASCKCLEFCEWFDHLTDDETAKAEDDMIVPFEAGYAAAAKRGREALEVARNDLRLHFLTGVPTLTQIAQRLDAALESAKETP